ncbi:MULTISPECIES: hypothetical protein [Acetobacter]|uniref:hypothetical protein n=1 Tax=Acetobacter TaxID=434 RepID=UPI0018E993BE|nr:MULTISPECIES: hypothetical protein [Acetobacter]MBS0960365.1 hypothetical protein [Acetobacter thailandicus]MBS0986233.1 hypothetical protein [Acetobacter thailandicus]MBS1003303.1 hypothetical protein [Acetobacter thailandicus]
MTEQQPSPLFGQTLSVVNIGIDLFAETLRQQSVDVVQVQWSPPATQNEDLMNLLDSLL